MFGCLRRLGCLVLLLAIGAALWFTRARWEPRLFGARTPATARWTPVSDSAARGADSALQSLAQPRGRAFVDLAPSQLGALLLAQAGPHLPPSLQDPGIAVVDDRLLFRGNVRLDDIKGLDALGPIGNFSDRREQVEIGGRVEMVHRGLAEFIVETARVGELRLPQAAIPRVIALLWRGSRPEGVSPSALPVPLPASVGDVRVARGRITLYRATP